MGLGRRGDHGSRSVAQYLPSSKARGGLTPMSRSTQVIITGILLALLVLFYQGLWGDPKHIPTVLIGTSAPEFQGPDVESGELISLSQFHGKVIVLNFWASWCQECKTEHENLLRLHARFRNHPDFVMLGVNYQDEPEAARTYLRLYGSSFRHVRDIKGTVAIDYGVYGVPETFVIDREGIIRYKWVGPLVGEIFTHFTQQVLLPLLNSRQSTPT
ncbi:MAG: DsbE family thiol:disulfide interchange protein [Nitrospirae bacterium]|nr:MAG: DsbE family thiol:disulfide interchange protein [Nitrospirota bacterium]